MSSIKDYLQEQFLDRYDDPRNHIRCIKEGSGDTDAVLIECSEAIPAELLDYIQRDAQLWLAGVVDISRAIEDKGDDRHLQAKITLKHDDSPEL